MGRGKGAPQTTQQRSAQRQQHGCSASGALRSPGAAPALPARPSPPSQPLQPRSPWCTLMALPPLVSTWRPCTRSSAFRNTGRPGRAAMAALVVPSPGCVACGGRVAPGRAGARMLRHTHAVAHACCQLQGTQLSHAPPGCKSKSKSSAPSSAPHSRASTRKAPPTDLRHKIKSRQHVARLAPALDVRVEIEAWGCAGVGRAQRGQQAARCACVDGGGACERTDAGRPPAPLPPQPHMHPPHTPRSPPNAPPRRCRMA